MQVKTLIKALLAMDQEQEICAAVYTKSDFDYSPEDEVKLTEEGWNKICQDFDEYPESEMWENISAAVSEVAVPK
jgi:hypothetical protein